MKTVLSAALASIAALMPTQSPAASDSSSCDPVVKAISSTLHAAAYRQFVTLGGQPERPLSVAIGDSVYLSLLPGHWEKSDRRELIASTDSADARKKYVDCHAASGDPSVPGAKVYEYNAVGPLGRRPGKVWIASDGLLVKQELGRGYYMRFEYGAMKPPI